MTDTHSTPAAGDRAPGALLAHTLRGDIPIEFSTSGAVSDGDRHAMVDVFDKLLAPVDEPVRHIRVRMEHADDRNKVRGTTIRAVLDLRGGSIRSSVSEATTHDAVMALDAKLRAQLRHRIERQQSLSQRGNAVDGSWRHGTIPAERPGYFPRAAEDREIIRHKSVAPGLCSIEEALFDLTMMDYDFYLYVDETTGRAALVFRSDATAPSAAGVPDDAAFHVRFVGGPVEGHVAPQGVALEAQPAPELSQVEARERLDAGHEPFVFFLDTAVQRGHVLYRRYDGHYGLLVPQDE